MSSQIDNHLWSEEFHALASSDHSDLDSLDDYEAAELPISSQGSQDFLRARRHYHTPVDREDEDATTLLD